MGVVRDSLWVIGRKLDEIEGERDQRTADPRCTEEHRSALARQARDAARSYIARELRKLWGNPATGTRGRAWDALNRAEERLLEARRTAPEQFSPVALADEYRRLPGILARFGALDELTAWYESRATPAERRALQDRGCELLPVHFAQPIGAFLIRLAADRQGDYRTAEVEAAEEAMIATLVEMVAGYDECRKLAAAYELNADLDETARMLGQVRLSQRFDPDRREAHGPPPPRDCRDCQADAFNLPSASSAALR